MADSGEQPAAAVTTDMTPHYDASECAGRSGFNTNAQYEHPVSRGAEGDEDAAGARGPSATGLHSSKDVYPGMELFARLQAIHTEIKRQLYAPTNKVGISLRKYLCAKLEEAAVQIDNIRMVSAEHRGAAAELRAQLADLRLENARLVGRLAVQESMLAPAGPLALDSVEAEAQPGIPETRSSAVAPVLYSEAPAAPPPLPKQAGKRVVPPVHKRI